MRYPEPERYPRMVRAGSYEVTVAAKGEDEAFSSKSRTVIKPIHIRTTKVMSHALAAELRSRAHTLVAAEEAAAS